MYITPMHRRMTSLKRIFEKPLISWNDDIKETLQLTFFEPGLDTTSFDVFVLEPFARQALRNPVTIPLRVLALECGLVLEAS